MQFKCVFFVWFCDRRRFILLEIPISRSDPVTALCFSQENNVCFVGYTSGLLELWQNNAVIHHKQVNTST